MRILVVGSRGQLGRELLGLLAAGPHRSWGVDLPECDICEPGSVAGHLDAHHPEVVVNCAAYTAVDRAESEADACFRVNALGPNVLATCCRARGVRLVHISTDFVFDGSAAAPVDEWSEPAPLSVYGRSKLAGEREVSAIQPDHLIVRTAWLYGQEGPNFVLTMLRLARERGALRVVDDQHGTPTWTGHLAPALLRLVERGVAGTVHLTNSGATSWHGFAAEIVSAAGLHGVPVEPIGTADYPTPARRPARSVLDNRVWRLHGEPPLPGWREGLRAYLASRAGVSTAAG